MAVSSSNPMPEPARVTLLGSGSGTLTGSAAIQDIDNFSVGPIGNKTLRIFFSTTKTLGNSASYMYISSSAGGGIVTGMNSITISTSGTIGYTKIETRKDPNSSNHITHNEGLTSAAAATNSTLKTTADFDLTTAEIFYICAPAIGVGQDFKYTWLAVLEG